MGDYFDPDLLDDLAEDRQTYQKAQKVQKGLSKSGLMAKAQRLGMDFLNQPLVKSMMAGVRRWESARAVAFDEIFQKNPDLVEAMKGFTVELWGGTDILPHGIKIKDEARTQTTFDEVLKGKGLDGQGKLSDVVGKQWFSPYFDPTARGSLAFMLDVAADPTTYVSLGSGTAARQVVGKAGTVNLTRKGSELVERVYTSRIFKMADDMAIPRPAEMTDEAFEAVERGVLKKERDRLGMEGLGEQGLMHVQSRIEDLAGRRVADRLGREGTKGLTYEGGLRLFDMSWTGLDNRGITLISDEAMRAPARALRDAIRTGTPEPLLGKVDKAVELLDKTFKRVPRKVRQNALFRQMEDARFVMRNSGDRVAQDHLNHIYGTMAKTFLKDRQAGKLLMHYIERPDKYGQALRGYFGKDAEAVHLIAERWKSLANSMGSAGSDLNLITPEQFQHYYNRYIPHELQNLPEEMLERIDRSVKKDLKISAEYKGGSMYRYGQERHAETLDALRRALKENGLDPDKYINYNPVEVMQKYIKTHVDGVADANFANDLVAEFSPTVSTVLRSLMPDTERLNPLIREEHLQKMQVALSRANTLKDTPLFKDEYEAALKSIERMPAISRAAYLYERSRRITSLAEFEEFWKSHRKIIGKTSNDDLANMRKFIRKGVPKVDGHYVSPMKFEAGAWAGKERLVPAHMKEYFMEQSWKPRQIAVVEEILKKADFLTNSFKINHTVFALKFHTRNQISNLAAAASTLALIPLMNPVRIARVASIMSGKGDFTVRTATGRRFTREHMTQLHYAHDIMPARQQITDVAGKGSTVGTTKVGRFFGLDKVERVATTIGQTNENFARGMYFQTLIERGYTARRAAQLTKETFFDYSDLSAMEQDVLKRLFPFYTWTRKNIGLQAKNWAQRPAATLTQAKAIDHLSERGPEENLLPSYLNGDLKVRLTSDPGKGTFITNIDLPVQNVNILWNGGIRDTLKEQFNMVTPFLKAPLEYVFGKQNFGDRELNGHQFMGTVGKQMYENMPKPVVEWLELEPVQSKEGWVAYKGNSLKMWLLLNNGIIGRLVRDGTEVAATARELGSGDKAKGARMMMRLITGMNIEHIDLDEAQQRKLDESIKAYEKLLLDEGEAYKFEVFNLNKDNR